MVLLSSLSPLCSSLTLPVLLIVDLTFHRYDLLHNAHLNLEGLDELFKVAQVQMESTPTINLCSVGSLCSIEGFFDLLMYSFKLRL